MSHIHIHAPRHDIARLRSEHCPTCKRKTLFYNRHVPWYGWDCTCLRCGDSWEDAEMCPRPFRPGWRRDNIKNARKHYRRIGLIPGQIHEVGEYDLTR